MVAQDRVEISDNAGKAPRSIDISFTDVVNDVLRLKAILGVETELLRQMKIKEVRDILDEKLRLVRRLELQKRMLRENPSVLSNKNREDLVRLKEAASGMEGVIRENFREVLKAKEVNQRVIEALSKAVEQHERRMTGYDRSGRDGAAISGLGGYSSAVTMNQVV